MSTLCSSFSTPCMDPNTASTNLEIIHTRGLSTNSSKAECPKQSDKIWATTARLNCTKNGRSLYNSRTRARSASVSSPVGVIGNSRRSRQAARYSLKAPCKAVRREPLKANKRRPHIPRTTLWGTKGKSLINATISSASFLRNSSSKKMSMAPSMNTCTMTSCAVWSRSSLAVNAARVWPSRMAEANVQTTARTMRRLSCSSKNGKSHWERQTATRLWPNNSVLFASSPLFVWRRSKKGDGKWLAMTSTTLTVANSKSSCSSSSVQ
mmetsp:Transcript_51344/g.142101  ORF Transcript_51344/g.142101 Transcript_51344/m.142101 type:complete len:266 (+) Transcript_51344:166-963(+)